MSKELVLNPNIENLEEGSMTHNLYTMLKGVIEDANSVEAPDFTLDTPMLLDEEGNQLYDPDDPVVPLVDTETMQAKIDEYSSIQTANYAYAMANSIVSAIGGGSGDGSEGTVSGGFLPLSGGTLTGQLVAEYGVELGSKGQLLLRVTHNGDNEARVYIDAQTEISDNLIVEGQLTLSNDGIVFNKTQTIYVADEALHIDYSDIKISGDTEIDGKCTIGAIVLDPEKGILLGGYEYYHSGNSNNSEVDWSAKDLHVYEELTVDGGSTLNGFLTATHGFTLGVNGEKKFYIAYDEKDQQNHIYLGTDLTILGYDNGIKFDGHYLLKTRSSDQNVISICAPGRILNLGDSDDDVATKSIALQANFNTATNKITLITPGGEGFFLGLSASSTSAGSTVLKTYRVSSQNEGVLFPKRIALKISDGAYLSSDDGQGVKFGVIYNYTDSSGVAAREEYNWSASMVATDSLWRNQSINTPTVSFDTGAQFFRFNQPVESSFFSIISQTYSTKLEAGVLFLNTNSTENLFLQATGNAIFHSGNATFNHSLSSVEFTSGFAGSGWAILEDSLTGSFAATFDELTVRKKMRIYELEIQKINVTNGSLWVSDSCSGDTVEQVV